MTAKHKVYYNLHKHCLSIMLRGKVLEHSTEFFLKDVEFRVSQAGRNRVLKEQRKNVLSFISKDDSSGQFNYEVNTPIFIDLNNKKELLVRNIEANLLYGDYSEFAIQSDASMTLLIKEKGE